MREQAAMHARVAAWAKVNLDLRILAREDTGFHQLETIFHRISLCDLVDVRVGDGAPGITLACSPAVDVADEQNLAWRAAAAYQHAAHWPPRDVAIAITVQKVIPTGGGLGGGSADAGAVLRALNALHPAPLATDALLTVAATLGADVPFLASEHPCALAWGRGERMLALPALPQRAVHGATFRHGVNTALAYRELALSRSDGRITAPGSMLHDLSQLARWEDITMFARNDFEGPVFAMRPDVAAAHAAFRAMAPDAFVRMSGSGATVFAAGAIDAETLCRLMAQWPDDDSIQLLRAATLEHVPPVSILSLPSVSR